jgi:hypothetical protein
MMRAMRMVLLTVLVLGMASCMDDEPEVAKSPVEPAVQQTQVEAGSTAAASAIPTVSTPCQSYRKELDEVTAQLAQTPGVAELEQKKAGLTAIVADVCN